MARRIECRIGVQLRRNAVRTGKGKMLLTLNQARVGVLYKYNTIRVPFEGYACKSKPVPHCSACRASPSQEYGIGVEPPVEPSFAER